MHNTQRTALQPSGVLDRPADVDLSKRAGWDSDRDTNITTLPPEAEAGSDKGSTDRQRRSPPGGGNFRVLLLDNPKHVESMVVKGITAVVPTADETHARNCYSTSKSLGMAIITSCLKEHAEFYAQQLYRYGLSTAIEPDGSTS
eukprot:jgi/Chrzof1/12514/Cz06g36300.t1